MKPEEAIRELSEMQEGIKYHGLKGQHYWFRWIHSQGKDIFTTSIQALEKQIPVNPNGYDNGGAEDYEEWAECPKCSESIPEYTMENETECYCIGCGQKLKWEVEG